MMYLKNDDYYTVTDVYILKKKLMKLILLSVRHSLDLLITCALDILIKRNISFTRP